MVGSRARRAHHLHTASIRTDRVSFDLGTYTRRVRPVEVAGLDFAAFERQPLAEADLRCIRYMHDVEFHTSCYLRDLLNTSAHADPEVSTFLTMWNYEEHWHGEALASVLAAHGEQGGEMRITAMRDRLRRRMRTSPLMWMGISAATRHFLAIHMTVGAINEWTTQAGYARLAARAGHPVLSELLRRIMRQEGLHIDFYRSRASALLDRSPKAQRATRLVLRYVWRPVGAGVMPTSEVRHVVGHLFADAEGRAVAARIDRRIDRLPGLAGLGLMRRTVRRYGPLPASTVLS